MASSHWNLVARAWSETFQIVRAQRILFMPLGISAAVKTTILGVALIVPFPPFSNLFAPAVRYFWGDLYLHYPYHLALASRWFKQTDLLIPILLEGLLIGTTAVLTRHLLMKHHTKPRQVFAETFRRYPAITLLTVLDVFLTMLCAQLSTRPVGLLFQKLLPSWWAQSFLGPLFVLAVVVTVVSAAVESLLILAIPACVVEGRSTLRALAHSVQTGLRAYGWIFLTVLAVTLFYLPVLLIRHGSTRLVESPWPESILLVYLVRIFFSWVIGTLLTVWATIYLVRVAEAVPGKSSR